MAKSSMRPTPADSDRFPASKRERSVRGLYSAHFHALGIQCIRSSTGPQQRTFSNMASIFRRVSKISNISSQRALSSVRNQILRVGVPTRCLSVSAVQQQKKPFSLGKINHIAIAVPDLEKSSAFYRDVLGATVTEPQPQPEHGVYTVFIELGDTKIELLHPYGENSPIAKFLERNKDGGMHHICLEVDDVDKAISHLREKKIRLLSEKSKIGAHGKPVIFLHPKDCCGVLTELEQE